ncbi:MAG: hypothetical protein ACREEP_01720 [Dongiaceae bacterium]
MINPMTAVFLINKYVRAVQATYEDGHAPGTFKTLDQTICIGDLVVVPTDTRHKMTVVKVTAADVDIDFDSSAPVHWIIARVDLAAHKNTLEQEAAALAAIRSAELRKKRADLADSLLKDSMADIKALPIAVRTGEAPSGTA